MISNDKYALAAIFRAWLTPHCFMGEIFYSMVAVWITIEKPLVRFGPRIRTTSFSQGNLSIFRTSDASTIQIVAH